MYLSKIEIVGFKSFANRTDLAFPDGLTAIVGPNGCGKTNIVDAIRWVLGAQRSSMLRADSMEQVIFNGSRTVKPLGMAEVSLTIENTKNILPTEYSQVVITRRLFRNGDSQYLLNKTQCRLRDILDLFMDTGMGADAYSVIELKMVETILSDKADDRRHLFEEAAGVVKYKQRRREASRKLEAARQDISRVQDITREVSKTVSSLGRQAEKARQHNELQELLRDKERLIFAFDYFDEYRRKKELDEHAAETVQKLAAITDRLNEAEVSADSLEQAIRNHEQAISIERDTEQALLTGVSELREKITIATERRTAAERTIERIEREDSENVEQRSSTERELMEVRSRQEQLRVESESASAVLATHRNDYEEKKIALSLLREAVVQGRTNLDAQRYAMADLRAAADRHHVRADGLQRRLKEIEASAAVTAKQLENAVTAVHEHAASVIPLDESFRSAEQRFRDAENRLESLRNEQESLRSALQEKNVARGQGIASLEFLAGLTDTGESGRFLMDDKHWQPAGGKVTLADVVNTSDELRIAIDAALGDLGRFFVVEATSDATQAMASLKSHNAGKAAFICRDSIPMVAEPAPLPSSDGVFGWVSEVVQADDALRSALRIMLSGYAVVENMDVARMLVSAGMCTAAFTLQGEAVTASGIMRGGSVSRTEGMRVGRRERMSLLQDEIINLEANVASIEERLTSVAETIQSIDLRQLSEDVRAASVAANEGRQRLQTFEQRVQELSDRLSAGKEELKSGHAEIEHETALSRQASESAALAQEQIINAEAALAADEGLLPAYEDASSSALAELRAVELTEVRLNAEIEKAHSEEQRLAMHSQSIESRREQRAAERHSLHAELAELTSFVQEQTARLDQAINQLNEQRQTRLALEDKGRTLSKEFHHSAETLRGVRRELDAVKQELHDVDVKSGEVGVRLASLLERGVTELGVDTTAEPRLPDVEELPETTRAAIAELRRKLTSMGNVNFLALEEHEKENERLTFLTAQLTDLIDGERTLIETIDEINKTAGEKFTSTFTRIRENFIMLFKMLFSDQDEADLSMTDGGDPLECKIEIIAKPRGKQPHSIDMLSGGEKTLTAIALLFAIYLVKPSPFCILDEVDAPLDDANIDRYLNIIRRFSQNTQFLMITHNKRTMEAADTLYGVTMEDPGVSKVVSVRLAGVGDNAVVA